MFFVTKVRLISREASERNESIGCADLNPEEEDIVFARVNVNHIESYWPEFKKSTETILSLVSGNELVALEPLESIEKKIQQASLITIGN